MLWLPHPSHPLCTQCYNKKKDKRKESTPSPPSLAPKLWPPLRRPFSYPIVPALLWWGRTAVEARFIIALLSAVPQAVNHGLFPSLVLQVVVSQTARDRLLGAIAATAGLWIIGVTVIAFSMVKKN